MKQQIRRGQRASEGTAPRWTLPTLDPSADSTGVDSDIERLLGSLQAKYGYTRDKASAELVRKLSFAVCAA